MSTIEISGNKIIVINGKQYEIEIKDIDIILKPVNGPPVPDPDPNPQQPPTETGTVKPGGWGGNQDPKTWKATNMKKPKDQFKVVDNKGINIATNFTTKEAAQAFINWSVGHAPPPIDPPPVDPGNPPPTPTGTKDQFGILKIAPDKPNGKTNTSFELEEKERNYESGKPSEWSVEYTADLGEKLSDIEVTYYCKINGFKTNEADNISTKILGPSHSDGVGRSWYIGELATDGSSSKTLMTETPHPVYFDNNQKALFTVGESIVGKWVGIKMVTYLINGGKDRRLEMWLDWPVSDIANPPNNWRMYWGVDDTGQLDHAHFIQPTGSLVCSRIDGVEKGDPPEFKYASVREVVAPTGGQNPPPPISCPTGQHWDSAQNKCVDDTVIPPPPEPTTGGGGVDKFGVKSIYPQTGKIAYDYILKPNAGLRHNFDAVKFPTPNNELTGYFSINQAPDDEVSGKWSVTTHSGSNHVKCLDVGVDNNSGACRYRYEDPHPSYTGSLGSGIKNGLPLESKYHGWKFIRLTLPDNSVQLEVWQDQGNNEGTTPANQWVQLAKWEVDEKYAVRDYPNGVYAVLRLDGSGIEANLKSKWLSYVEVKPTL